MFLLSLLMSLLRNNNEIEKLMSAYVIKERKMIRKGGFKTYKKTVRNTCMLLQQPKLLYCTYWQEKVQILLHLWVFSIGSVLGNRPFESDMWSFLLL